MDQPNRTAYQKDTVKPLSPGPNFASTGPDLSALL